MTMTIRHIFVFYILAWVWFGISSALAADIKPELDFARHGNNILLAFQYAIPPEYHSYANDPGEGGLPTKLTLTLENSGAMPILYPRGIPAKDAFDPQATVDIYKGGITLLAILPPDAYNRDFAANLEMLLCSNRHCLPYSATLTGHVPDKIPLLIDVPWQAQAEELLESEGDSIGALSLEEGSPPPPVTIDSAIDSAGENSQDNIEGEKSNEDTKQGQNIIEIPENFDLGLDPFYANSDMEIYTLGKALMLGILAGLLLNAMPCVLPVLTLKVSGLLLLGDRTDKEKMREFREHNIFFAAGVMTFFSCLALFLGAADLMWGQLYQSQGVLLVMLLLVFLMGLSMLGVFTLPAFDLKIGTKSRNPRLKSYCTGLVSTFLATPCSGPMLGGVLAWAFAQTLPVLLAVFLAVGFGMSLPYLAFCVWPNMARILPRPGNWMYVFEHILGFLLLGTALYLLSILPADKHMQILGMLLAASLCAWLWGKFGGLGAPLRRRRILGTICLAFLGFSTFWILRPPVPSPQWQDFTPGAFVGELGKKNMLVEFTADWCPNCKFLEATVLSADNLRSWRKKYGLELVKVDLTRPDAYAERLLSMLGSKSIPLTAIFPKGENASRPLVLRDLYGEKTLDRALRQSLGNS